MFKNRILNIRSNKVGLAYKNKLTGLFSTVKRSLELERDAKVGDILKHKNFVCLYSNLDF